MLVVETVVDTNMKQILHAVYVMPLSTKAFFVSRSHFAGANDHISF